jgi:hypothetical protein
MPSVFALLRLTYGQYDAAIALHSNYMAGSFATTAAGLAGTLISSRPQTDQPLLTHPSHG